MKGRGGVGNYELREWGGHRACQAEGMDRRWGALKRGKRADGMKLRDGTFWHL